jgi:hypothetical protein
MVKGRPKYCIGNIKGLNLSKDVTVGTRSNGISMGRKPLLFRLIFNPDSKYFKGCHY